MVKFKTTFFSGKNPFTINFRNHTTKGVKSVPVRQSINAEKMIIKIIIF